MTERVTAPTTDRVAGRVTDRARQIIAAARTLLEAEGPEALTMRRLADSIGITAPSLYKHFPDKSSVLTALAGEVLSEKDLSKRIKLLERQMLEHAKNLEFEKAARTRDELAALREQAFGASVADNVVTLPGAAPAAPLKRN